MILKNFRKLKIFILFFLLSKSILSAPNFIHGVYETELGKDEDGYLHVELKECLNSEGLFCGYIHRAFEYPSHEIDEKYEQKCVPVHEQLLLSRSKAFQCTCTVLLCVTQNLPQYILISCHFCLTLCSGHSKMLGYLTAHNCLPCKITIRDCRKNCNLL